MQKPQLVLKSVNSFQKLWS